MALTWLYRRYIIDIQPIHHQYLIDTSIYHRYTGRLGPAQSGALRLPALYIVKFRIFGNFKKSGCELF